MLNSPNRDRGEPKRLLTSSFPPKLVLRYLEVGNGRYRVYKQFGTAYVRIPNCILLWASGKKQLFLRETHPSAIISRAWRGWRAPARPTERCAASRLRGQVSRSRFQTGGLPGGRTFQFRG